jgi:hypothetical protein
MSEADFQKKLESDRQERIKRLEEERRKKVEEADRKQKEFQEKLKTMQLSNSAKDSPSVLDKAVIKQSSWRDSLLIGIFLTFWLSLVVYMNYGDIEGPK